jgi:hypothetical protein
MKQAICILTVFVTVGLTAQQPSSPPSTPPGVFAAPGAAPPIVGFTNSAGSEVLDMVGIINQFGTNVNSAQVASALTALQNDIQQTLGLIASINANPRSISAAELQVPRGRAAPAPGDLSKDLAGSAAVNVGQDLGANVATPTGNFSFTAPPPPSASEAGNSATTAPALATPPAGVTAALGVASPVGSVSTNAPAGPAASANSVALLILQNDLQRVLAEIAALNGESVFVAAPLTNEPAAQGTTPATRLTPTGR